MLVVVVQNAKNYANIGFKKYISDFAKRVFFFGQILKTIFCDNFGVTAAARS